MVSASEKINVIPSRARLSVDCRVPPGLGEEHALERIHALLGEDGFEIEFHDTVVGNRSPIDTPLMDHIQAFVEREDPGATAVPVVLPGFSDSRWFRSAFPDCTAYGFFPQRRMDLFEAMPLVHGADERVPVEDLGLAADLLRRARARRCSGDQAGARGQAAARRHGAAQRPARARADPLGGRRARRRRRDPGGLGPQAAAEGPRGRAHARACAAWSSWPRRWR